MHIFYSTIEFMDVLKIYVINIILEQMCIEAIVMWLNTTINLSLYCLENTLHFFEIFKFLKYIYGFMCIDLKISHIRKIELLK